MEMEHRDQSTAPLASSSHNFLEQSKPREMVKQVTSTAGEKVKVSLIPITRALPSGDERDYFQVLVRVEPPSAVKKRVPIDLVAVLDVSSSMDLEAAPPAKKPSRLDLLKRGMRFVVRQLNEDDGLAIVAFNDKLVSEHSTDMFRISGKRIYAENILDKLVAKGDTAFNPGLEQAVKILDARTEKNRLGVILLLTDGIENSKITENKDHPSVARIRPELLKKYPVHTFGFCAAHDPNMLLSIAQQSCGTYSFIDDKHLGKITDAFAIFLGGLRTIVALDMVVHIYSHSTLWRSELKSITCGFESMDIPKLANEGGYPRGEIRIGMLYAGEVKNFMAHFKVEPDTSVGRAISYLRFYYKDTLGSLSDISGDGHNSYLDTSKLTGDARQSSLMVREQAVRFEVVYLVSTLQTELRNLRNIVGIKEYKPAMDVQISAGSTLQSKWEEFMETMDYAQKEGLDLDDLKEELKEMVSSLKRGGGMAYMCSWVSSQQMQRATLMGSADRVGIQFVTPAMEKMLAESKKYHVELEPAGSPAATTPTEQKPQIPQPASSLHGQRMAAWDKLKSEAKLMFQQLEDHKLNAIRKALLDAIKKAKRDDMNLILQREEDT